MNIYALRKAGSLREIVEDFAWDIPEHYNVALDACDKHAESNRSALFYQDLKNQRRIYTFSDMKRMSDQLAGHLLGHGVKHGDRVAMMLPNSPQAAATLLAVLKIRAIAVPLSILYGSESLVKRLQDCQPKVIVAAPPQAEKVFQSTSSLPSLRLVLLVGKQRRSAHALRMGKAKVEIWDDGSGKGDTVGIVTRGGSNPEPISSREVLPGIGRDARKGDPALLMYTSGTTGAPKGVLLPHMAILSRIVGIQLAHFPFPEKDDVFWSPVEWAWTGGCANALLIPWVLGVPVMVYERESSFDPRRALLMLEAYKVRNCFFSPGTLYYFRKHLSETKAKYELNIRTAHSGGEALSEELFHWAKKAFGVTVNEIFGLTEAGIVIGNCAPLEPVHPGSMGKAIPGHEVAVFNATLDRQLVDADGLLGVRAGQPSVFSGYWRDEELTRKVFTKGWYISGDIVSVNGEKHFWFRGRRDVIAKVGGYRVSPLEVESILSRHEAVESCAVVAVPDREIGHILKAYVVVKQGYESSPSLAESIQNFARQLSGFHQYPKQIEFVEDIPSTISKAHQKKGLAWIRVEGGAHKPKKSVDSRNSKRVGHRRDV